MYVFYLIIISELLHMCLHTSGGSLDILPQTSCRMILACAVLHNIAIRARLPEPEPLMDDQLPEDPTYENADGIAARNGIIQSFDYLNIHDVHHVHPEKCIMPNCAQTAE